MSRQLTGAAALELSQDLAALPLERIDHLDLSLDAVEAIDSSGIAAIVRLYGHMARTGGRLRLVDAAPEVVRGLKEVGLDGVIPVVPRED